MQPKENIDEIKTKEEIKETLEELNKKMENKDLIARNIGNQHNLDIAIYQIKELPQKDEPNGTIVLEDVYRPLRFFTLFSLKNEKSGENIEVKLLERKAYHINDYPPITSPVFDSREEIEESETWTIQNKRDIKYKENPPKITISGKDIISFGNSILCDEGIRLIPKDITTKPEKVLEEFAKEEIKNYVEKIGTEHPYNRLGKAYGVEKIIDLLAATNILSLPQEKKKKLDPEKY